MTNAARDVHPNGRNPTGLPHPSSGVTKGVTTMSHQFNGNGSGKGKGLIDAVTYLRRSSDDPSQEYSIEDQRKHVTEFAAEKGYRVVREYVDDGISGDNTAKRKDFLRMIDDAQRLGDFKAIVCWD